MTAFLAAPRARGPEPSMDDVKRTIFNGFETWGADSIEVEFRLGKITKTKFLALLDTLSKCHMLEEMPRTKTREQFNGTEARVVHDIAQDGSLQNERTLYKKKLITKDLRGGIRLQTCLERHGNPDLENPYTMYRIKDRRSFNFADVWRFDLTMVETNDPRYSDADDYIYEAEIELFTQSDSMYFFTVEHLLTWGEDLTRQLLSIE